MSATRMLVTVVGVFAAAWLTGCQTPGGGLFAHADGPSTIVSTETLQKSVTMVDLRSGEVFFAMDLPPGKQLTWKFDKGDGDDPVYTPDIMRYEVKEIGNQFGKLHNAMTVPGAASRRVDVYLKQSVQYGSPSPEEAVLRTDQASDRPDWWTPRGGALPEDSRHSLYDGGH